MYENRNAVLWTHILPLSDFSKKGGWFIIFMFSLTEQVNWNFDYDKIFRNYLYVNKIYADQTYSVTESAKSHRNSEPLY
jgi:hypothetical protein